MRKLLSNRKILFPVVVVLLVTTILIIVSIITGSQKTDLTNDSAHNTEQDRTTDDKGIITQDEIMEQPETSQNSDETSEEKSSSVDSIVAPESWDTSGGSAADQTEQKDEQAKNEQPKNEQTEDGKQNDSVGSTENYIDDVPDNENIEYGRVF